MNAHTPGPWRLFGFLEVRGTSADGLPDGPLIARMPPAPDIPVEERAANAQLIAAAPELLHACRAARELCDLAGLDGIKRVLAAAIDKAEGAAP